MRDEIVIPIPRSLLILFQLSKLSKHSPCRKHGRNAALPFSGLDRSPQTPQTPHCYG
jgi:hypothetical protein